MFYSKIANFKANFHTFRAIGNPNTLYQQKDQAFAYKLSK